MDWWLEFGFEPLAFVEGELAMGQNPVLSVNIPIPTKIGSKMGGAPTPKWDPIGFDSRPIGRPLLNHQAGLQTIVTEEAEKPARSSARTQ